MFLVRLLLPDFLLTVDSACKVTVSTEKYFRKEKLNFSKTPDSWDQLKVYSAKDTEHKRQQVS